MMTTESKVYHQASLVMLDDMGNGVEWFSKTYDTMKEAREEVYRKEDEVYEKEEEKESKDIVTCIHKVFKTATECKEDYEMPLEWVDMTDYKWD